MKTILAKTWRRLNFSKGIQLSVMRVVQDQFLIGVTGVIFNSKNEVLLFKHTYRQNRWSLPGGYLKAGEHPFEGLEREVLEESGLVVSGDEELKIRTDRETSRIDITVIGQFIGGIFRQSHEVSEYAFFDFDHLPEIMHSQLVVIEQAINHRQTSPQDRNKTKPSYLPRTKIQVFSLKLRHWLN